MAIKRYVANADNTIVNAYQTNNRTRATGSNSGQSDVLEVYSIYGRQASTSSAATASQELSRVLINFPITDISADRTAGKIPASGSISWFLRMYSAETSKTVPREFDIVAVAVSSSWQEGLGLDLENYSDLTSNGSGSNWVNANGDVRGATATVTAQSVGVGAANTRQLKVTDIAGNSVTFLIDNSISTSTATNIAFSGAASNATTFATRIAAAINAANSAGTLNVSATSSDAVVTLTQTTNGHAGNGNSSLQLAGTAVSEGACVTVASTGGYHFSGGNGTWKRVGGDFLTGSEYNPHVYTQSFGTGLGDIEMDVSEQVEDWIREATGSYGFGVMLASAYEAYTSESSGVDGGSVIHNPDGAKRSYYTKRFFGRGSQYFFKRPVLEARWDSDIIRDDRGDFQYSSSLATNDENLNTIYLYNYVRGRLRNIPAIGTGNIYVSLYTGSVTSSVPSGESQRILLEAAPAGIATHTAATGSHVSTGIYKCEICLTKSTTDNIPRFYDVWHSADNASTYVEYFTGSIKPKTLQASTGKREPVYFTNITNLQNSYMHNQNARFNIYVREKNWNPTIYSKAVETPETINIRSASYRVIRIKDGLEAIPHQTGAVLATGLSYDINGNYFDFDMNLLQPGYEYGFKIAFYDDELTSWQEQDRLFKFRVNKNEH
jgi:hypothetical protein